MAERAIPSYIRAFSLSGGTQSAATKLAADMDANSSLGAADFGLGALAAISASGSTASVTAPIAINNKFSVTKQCPKGGQVVLAGTIVGTGDQSTRNLTVDATAIRQCRKKTLTFA